jgi:hypothetical protein
MRSERDKTHASIRIVVAVARLRVRLLSHCSGAAGMGIEMKTSLFVALSAAAAGSAVGQFNSAFAGPINSVGPLGNAGNGVVLNTYAGASTIFGGLNITGTLTEVNLATFASEARWNIVNTGFGVGANFQSTTTTSFTGSIPINANFGLLQWANPGDQFRFEAFESFDDSGVDSAWTNVSFSYSTLSGVIDLGNLADGTYTFDTNGSSFDTEIAIFSSTGTLIGTDDDGGAGLQSLITSNLAGDTFYIVVGGFDSGFANGLALAGTATGTYALNLGGLPVASGTLAARQFAVFSVNVPAPASAAILGLGGLAVARRRR